MRRGCRHPAAATLGIAAGVVLLSVRAPAGPGAARGGRSGRDLSVTQSWDDWWAAGHRLTVGPEAAATHESAGAGPCSHINRRISVARRLGDGGSAQAAAYQSPGDYLTRSAWRAPRLPADRRLNGRRGKQSGSRRWRARRPANSLATAETDGGPVWALRAQRSSRIATSRRRPPSSTRSGSGRSPGWTCRQQPRRRPWRAPFSRRRSFWRHPRPARPR